ncbi:hypothetical protein [Cohnella silvisoli]|uniref:DUF4179 domain-containing protein n=1 Tax=Cohnella silvisoli TaxID=2873699 RepID=A0ABV1L1P7_9BACL|nr:hypothetical protein [Cohnella silvisoli]MCD9025343.1 hypothetical protein [Cohnella silvisoli]
MKDNKPEWYARMKRGPFEVTKFDSEMMRKVEERALIDRIKPRKKRFSPWAAAVATAIVLIGVYFLVPKSSLSYPDTQEVGAGKSEMTAEYVREHLKIGMAQEDVKNIFGNAAEGQSVKRDFAQPHQDDPNDMRTWTAVDIWRYDYGVGEGYSVHSDLEKDNGFDMPGIENGNIESQLVIVWKDNKVERAFYKYMSSKGLESTQIGPAIEDFPDTEPPISDEAKHDSEYPSLEVRAIGESTLGKFELRPRKGSAEKIQPLGAPSCLGLDTDLTITGDYELFFKATAGGESLIQNYEALEIIQKENKAIMMQKFDFPKVELYLFIPRYTDCHGLEFYAYGIDKKTGEASAFTFQEGDNAIPYWTTSPMVLPTQLDDQLVVEGGRFAGTDGATRYRFQPDLNKHQMMLEGKEQIP